MGSGAMILGGMVATFFDAAAAEGKSPEDLAKPLPVIAKPAETIFHPGGQPGGLGTSADD